MPPKAGSKKDKGPGKKAEQKAKAQILDDKTFGLKNKSKSKAVKEFVKQVTAQVMHGADNKGGMRKMEEEKFAAEKAKKADEKKKNLMHSLFASLTAVQKVDSDGNKIDPKTILCPMFQQGMCEKGKRCKNSHTLSTMQAKTANIDIYTDPREKIKMAPDSIITCKHFLEAVEKELYGFNWVCPNKGQECEYRHMLPPGFVLTRDKKKAGEESEGEELTMEEKIEEERALLKSEDLTPVTPETFAAWKVKRAERRAAILEQKIKEQEMKGKKDKSQMAFMSGKALFTYNPELFQDDDNAADEYVEAEDSDAEEEESKKEETLEQAGMVDKELFKEEMPLEEPDFD